MVSKCQTDQRFSTGGLQICSNKGCGKINAKSKKNSDTMNKTKDKKCDMGELHKKKNKKKSVNLMLC